MTNNFYFLPERRKWLTLSFLWFYNFPFTVALLPHIKKEDAFHFGKSEDVLFCCDISLQLSFFQHRPSCSSSCRSLNTVKFLTDCCILTLFSSPAQIWTGERLCPSTPTIMGFLFSFFPSFSKYFLNPPNPCNISNILDCKGSLENKSIMDKVQE